MGGKSLGMSRFFPVTDGVVNFCDERRGESGLQSVRLGAIQSHFLGGCDEEDADACGVGSGGL